MVIKKDNLAADMEKRLPVELVEFMQEAGLTAAGRGESLYLACGVARDLLLGRPSLDIDLVVVGDAVGLAGRLADASNARITVHNRFRTATLKWYGWSVDVVTARSETYERPGALPNVKPADIDTDLFRRDFTINTLAVKLSPGEWGEVIDLYGGCADLEDGLIRVLHEGSFIDDATRIWRAVRYEQRLGFRLERRTLALLKRDIPMLETISADRIRHELELVLEEEAPEKVIKRLDGLGALAEIHPGLKGDAWLSRKFHQARQNAAPEKPTAELYLALLAYRLTGEESGKLIQSLKPPKKQVHVLKDTQTLKENLNLLEDKSMARSELYYLLKDRSQAALDTVYLATDSAVVRRNIRLFLDKLRHVKPFLTGRDLDKIGIPSGPRMKAILESLLKARLDGTVKTRRQEVDMAEQMYSSPITSF